MTDDRLRGRLLLLAAPDEPLSGAQVERATRRIEEVITEPYRADADRLAKALRELDRVSDPTYEYSWEACASCGAMWEVRGGKDMIEHKADCDLRAALAAHDELVKR